MKIILAVDLHESDIQRDPLIYEELKLWCENIATDVRPVFVYSSGSEVDLSSDFLSTMPEPPENLKAFAPLKVLQTPQVGRKKEIEALLNYASEQGADLIALVSQGKSGLEKKLLGSFAETLLLKSEIPLLFLDQEMGLREKTNKVLFATDFSVASKEAFGIFLNHIKHQQPEIVLFNAILLPQFSATGQVYAQALNILPQQYWDDQRKWAEARGNEFVALAQNTGLQARVEIANQVYSIENSIHEVVRREKVKLVAMVSVSQPLQRFLIGSVSRSILRTRIKPIWICGPQCLGNKPT